MAGNHVRYLWRRFEAVLFRELSKRVKIYLYRMEAKTKENCLDKLQVLHKSDHYLAVNKDFDVVINTNEDEKERLSVFAQVAYKYPELVNPELGHGFYVIHRLDYSTSGILLIGVNKEATTAAAKLFETRKTRKFYLGIVRGHIEEDRLDIDIPIGNDSRPEWEKIRMCGWNHSYCTKPRPSRTRCVVLERGLVDNSPATKVLLAPVTGRRHQLRVHLEEIGHPLVGDYTYSYRRDITPYRMYLHAYRLIVPSSLEHIDIQTEDPFKEENPVNKWRSTEVVTPVNDAFNILYDETLEWVKTERTSFVQSSPKK